MPTSALPNGAFFPLSGGLDCRLVGTFRSKGETDGDRDPETGRGPIPEGSRCMTDDDYTNVEMVGYEGFSQVELTHDEYLNY